MLKFNENADFISSLFHIVSESLILQTDMTNPTLLQN